MTGILLVDKPQGITSHDVVDRIRAAAGIRRVGHTGTLDPAATGLLILCLGKATRLSEHFTQLDKAYEGVMRMGVITDSYDLDGKRIEERPEDWPRPDTLLPKLSVETIQAACDAFKGDIEQIPPMVSAVKVGGERLYKKARKGEVVERKPRPVTIEEFKVLSYQAPDAHMRIRCTSGTYVRSLCHDVGQALQCGATLASLRRTLVGKHDVKDAAPVDYFQGEADVAEKLLPMGAVLDLPKVILKPSARDAVATGNTLYPADVRTECPVREGWVQLKDGNDELLALGQVESTAMGVQIHPKRVFI